MPAAPPTTSLSDLIMEALRLTRVEGIAIGIDPEQSAEASRAATQAQVAVWARLREEGML